MRADDAPDTSSGLLDQVRDRDDEAAWARFVQIYQPFIRQGCRAQHLPPDDAEEVTARVLVRLVVKMGRLVYDPGKSFRGWLSGVVRNEAMNYRRELSRKRPDRASGDSGVLRRLEQAPAPDCRQGPDHAAESRLAGVCDRLAESQPAGPYHAEAVAAYERAGQLLERQIERSPAEPGPRASLAIVRWNLGRRWEKADEPDRARQAYEQSARVFHGVAGQPLEDLFAAGEQVAVYVQLAGSYDGAGEKATALAAARQAAALAAQCAASPAISAETRYGLAVATISVGILLRKNGSPREALEAHELGMRLFEELLRTAAHPNYLVGLSDSLRWAARARWELGQHEEALASWRRSAAALRRLYEREPAAYRTELSKRLDSLVHRLLLLGRWAEAEACFLEHEQLWADAPDRLAEAARDLAALAERVGDGRAELSPEEQAERQRYREQSRRVARKAALARGPAESGRK